MNSFLTLLRLIGMKGNHQVHLGLMRSSSAGGVDVKRLKLEMAYHFMRGMDKKIIRAKMVLHDAEQLAQEYGTNEPLEIPEVKFLRQVFEKTK